MAILSITASTRYDRRTYTVGELWDPTSPGFGVIGSIERRENEIESCYIVHHANGRDSKVFDRYDIAPGSVRTDGVRVYPPTMGFTRNAPAWFDKTKNNFRP